MWAPQDTYTINCNFEPNMRDDELRAWLFEVKQAQAGPRKVRKSDVSKRRARNRMARQSRRRNG